MASDKKMTLEEYTKEVRRLFNVGAKPLEDVEEYFRKEETLDLIEEYYEEYYDPEMVALGAEGSSSPEAAACCLDYMY